jgi:hypothetical protein
MRKLIVKDMWCYWHAVADSCEHGNEHPGFTKAQEIWSIPMKHTSTYGFAAEYVLSATLLRPEMADNSFKK